MVHIICLHGLLLLCFASAASGEAAASAGHNARGNAKKYRGQHSPTPYEDTEVDAAQDGKYKSGQDPEALYNQYQAQAEAEEEEEVHTKDDADFSEVDESAASASPGPRAASIAEEDLMDSFEKAEKDLEGLKQLMRQLRRQESSGVSILEVQDAGHAVKKVQRERANVPGVSLMEKSEKGSDRQARAKGQTFPASPPVTIADYRAYQICNLTLAKAYNLLSFEISIQTQFGAAGWAPPVFVQDVMSDLSSAWSAAMGSGTQTWNSSGSFGWGSQDNLADNSVDMLTLQKLQVAMAWISLRLALQSGRGIWTSADQSALTQYCMKTQVMNNLEEQQANPSVVQGDIMITRLTSGLWARGNVPFCFSPGLSTGAKAAFQMAIDHIQAQVPCVTFTHINVNAIKQPPTCIAVPSIVVTNASPGCFSYLGQVDLVTGSQIVNLGPGCELMGMAIHQILHALGMAHEIARSDRNSYLSFNTDSSASRTTSTIFPVDYVQGFPVQNRPNNSTDNFDLLSMTMPPASTFSGDGFDTVEPNSLPILGRYMGQRHGLSEADAANLATLYHCQSNYPPRTPSWDVTTKWLQGVGFALDGKCLDRRYTGVGWRDGLNRNFSFTCTDLRLMCRDPVLGARTTLVCPATCLECIQPPESLQIYANGYGAYNAAQGQSGGGLNEYSWKHAPVQW